MSPRAVLAVAILAMLAPASSGLGQEWIGGAGVGVEVRDEAGQPIVGAAVVLVPEFGAPGDAPPFVFTDAAGRVEVFNLADGEWAIEIRAAGFMIFNGYLKLESGAGPAMGFSSRQRTGTFWQPLEVRFFEVGVEAPIMIGATAEARKEGRKRLAAARRLARQDEKAAERAEKRRRRRTEQGGGEVATLRPQDEPPEVAATGRTEPEPAAAPEPVVVEGASPPPLEVAEVEPGQASPDDIQARRRPPRIPPAPQPSPPRRAAIEPQVEPEAPREPPVFPPVREARPEPEPIEGRPIRVAETRPDTAPEVVTEPAVRPDPEPEAEPADVPAATVAPSRPAVPSIQERPVLFRGGACPECKPGEWALVVEREAAGTGPVEDCGSGRDAAVAVLLESGFSTSSGSASFAGPVADEWGNEMPAEVWSGIGPEPAGSLRPSAGSCQDLIAILPAGARFIGFRFEVSDDSGRSDCFGEDPCPIGQARWTSNPRIERSATVTVVHTSFLNESASRTRRARMTLYFRPLQGWEPPSGIAARSAPNRR